MKTIKTGRFKGYKIKLSRREKVAKYEERLLDLVADVFDIDGALITDESMLCDFYIAGEKEYMQKLHDDYGVNAKPSDYLVDIAERIWG